MSREHVAILSLFLINALIVLLYVLWHVFWRREKAKGYVIKSVIMLLCPVAGPVFFAGSYLFYWVFYKVKADLSDVVFSKEKMRTLVKADEEQGLGMAPIEEALAVSDTGSLRRLVLNVVRGDMSKSLASIALALNSEDSETSHYAASILQDELNHFRVTVQKLYIEIMKEEEDQCEYAVMLLDYMDQVLRQKVFTELEQNSFLDTMDEVGEIVYEKDKEKMTGTAYENLCLRFLDAKDYDRCQKWCLRGREEFPNKLSSYACLLKLYFSSGQKENFFQVLDELKHSSIVVDKETLELIRTFS